jgi:alpha-amylase
VALSAACAKRDVTAPVLDASVAISFSGRGVLVVQQALQLTATVHDTSGATLTRQTVQWTSADTTVATVSSSGLVTAGAPGTVVITATSDGGVAATTLTVVPHVSQVSVFLEPVGYLAVGGSMYVGVTALAANV